MNVVTLTKTGTMICNDKIVDSDPLLYLGYQVMLEEGFTLRSFLMMFDHYPEFKKLSAFSPNQDINRLDRQVSEQIGGDIDYLELEKKIEMIGLHDPPKLEMYIAFHAVSQAGSRDVKLLDLNFILDTPVKLGKLKHIIFGDKIDRLEFTTVYSLFEFIDGIMWELGFQSLPASCDIRRP